MQVSDLIHISDQALSVVSQAANFIRKHIDQVSADQVIEKGLNSLVSYVDREAEVILVEGLKKILPDSGFITEEEMTEQSQKSLTWIIDPLDGTTNFLHNIPYFSVSVALYDGEKLLLGIVHEVIHNEVFHAINGQGAWLNGQPLSVTHRADFSDVLVGTGFPYKIEHLSDSHMGALKQVLLSTRGIRRFGSAALDLCHVACGRFGAYYEKALNSYDIAAGALIVQEAGGYVSDFKGGEDWLFEGEILAVAPQFKDDMLDVLKSF
ncbi:MAG: inositol monophosphatase family protein [Saprospiraceae bacterium]